MSMGLLLIFDLIASMTPPNPSFLSLRNISQSDSSGKISLLHIDGLSHVSFPHIMPGLLESKNYVF